MTGTGRSWTLHVILAAEGAILSLLALAALPPLEVLLLSLIPAAIGVGWAWLLDAKTAKGGPSGTVHRAARWSCLLVLLSYGSWVRLVVAAETQDRTFTTAQEALCVALLFLSLPGIPVVAGCMHRSARVGWLTLTIPIPLVMAVVLAYGLVTSVAMTILPSDHGGMELVVARFYLGVMTVVLLVAVPIAAVLVLKLAATAPASRAWPGSPDEYWRYRDGRVGKLLSVQYWNWPAAVARAWNARRTEWKPGLVLGVFALGGSLMCTHFGAKFTEGWLVAAPLFLTWLRLLDLPSRLAFTVLAAPSALLTGYAHWLLGPVAALLLSVPRPLFHLVCNGVFWMLVSFWVGGRLPAGRLRSGLRVALLVLLLGPALTIGLWLLINRPILGPG